MKRKKYKRFKKQSELIKYAVKRAIARNET